MKKILSEQKIALMPAAPKEIDISADIENAALIGGNAMASSEPFGPIIGAAIGAVEEGLAILKNKKKPKSKL